MATITAKDVQELRAETGQPMLDCKNALTEAGGDRARAIEILQKKSKGKLEKLTDRTTGEGRIGIYVNDTRTVGGIVEVRCETAPVAKNELFVDLADQLARAVAAQSDPDPAAEKMLTAPAAGGRTLNDLVTEVYGKLREKIVVVGGRRVAGTYLSSYVHHDGKSGVLMAFDAKPSKDAIGPDLCQHAIFTRPLAIDRAGVPAAEVDKVRAMAREVAVADKKPPQIVDKIVDGKVNAFYSEKTLMEQEHVKPDYESKRVKDVLAASGVNAVTDMVIMRVGG